MSAPQNEAILQISGINQGLTIIKKQFLALQHLIFLFDNLKLLQIQLCLANHNGPIVNECKQPFRDTLRHFEIVILIQPDRGLLETIFLVLGLQNLLSYGQAHSYVVLPAGSSLPAYGCCLETEGQLVKGQRFKYGVHEDEAFFILFVAEDAPEILVASVVD